MKQETQRELLAYEEKNARIFQVMGSLKLLNIKVKAFVRKLEKVADDDKTKQQELNVMFKTIYQEVQFFKEEHRIFAKYDLHITSVDTFARNMDFLFSKNHEDQYTILEMRRVSVYIYRMADLMLKDLSAAKLENESRIHEIHARNGKYYFNRT